jgi:hypothetical protein
MAGARKLPTRDEPSPRREFIGTTARLRNPLNTRLQQDTCLSPGDYAVLFALSEAPATVSAPPNSPDPPVTTPSDRDRTRPHVNPH